MMRFIGWLVLLLATVPQALALDFRDLRPYLPATKQETDHFVVLCDNPSVRKEVCAGVEREGSRLWAELTKGCVKPWTEKLVVAVCARQNDFQKAAAVTKQGQDQIAPVLVVEGQPRRFVFGCESDAYLMTNEIPRGLSMHILETAFGGYERVPHWLQVGIFERESGAMAAAHVQRCRSAFKEGRRIQILTLITTHKHQAGKILNGDLFLPECMCFADFFLSKVSPERYKAFLGSVQQGAQAKASIGVAFQGVFPNPAALEQAFAEYVLEMD